MFVTLVRASSSEYSLSITKRDGSGTFTGTVSSTDEIDRIGFYIGNQGDGGGKPLIVFDEEQITQLEALAAVLSKGQIADYFCISETTLRAIEARQPEVSDAYKLGRVRQIASMGSNLVQLARSGNVAANIFYLKTQAGWRETEVEQREIPPLKIVLSNESDETAE